MTMTARAVRHPENSRPELYVLGNTGGSCKLFHRMPARKCCRGQRHCSLLRPLISNATVASSPSGLDRCLSFLLRTQCNRPARREDLILSLRFRPFNIPIPEADVEPRTIRRPILGTQRISQRAPQQNRAPDMLSVPRQNGLSLAK